VNPIRKWIAILCLLAAPALHGGHYTFLVFPAVAMGLGLGIIDLLCRELRRGVISRASSLPFPIGVNANRNKNKRDDRRAKGER
jgi:hypothetical protein